MVKGACYVYKIYIKYQTTSSNQYRSLSIYITKEVKVREAHSEKNKIATHTPEHHRPKVDIRDLREAERLFHLNQDAAEESRSVRRRSAYANRVHQVVPQSLRRITEQYKDKYRSTHSRARWINNEQIQSL